ncbi:MAG TPA: ComEA family DNA-binding protein [Natronosporangium sp.]|nr:ComEA family DNA-binding protein [Natronosporangium sp.]
MPDAAVDATATRRLVRVLAASGSPVGRDDRDHRDPDDRDDRDHDRHDSGDRDPGDRDPGPGAGLLARLSPAGAFDPGRPGRRALAAVAAVVALGAAGLAWWSRPQPEPVAPLAFATIEAPATTSPAELVVAVSGLVHQPGLVRLPPGARVADALAAAGGPLPDADLDHLNLARKVTDGELITVGIPPPAGDPAGSPAGGAAGALVNLNTASQAELETLPGIGPALAQRIIAYRAEHGPFQSVEELRQVSGIGEVRFAELRDLVTV